MPLWGVVGKMGAGKTLWMTYSLAILKAERKMKILANYNLHFPYEPIDMNALLDPNSQISNCAIGLDEFWVWADSRASSSNVNKMVSYFLLQSRKRDVEIFATAQSYDQLDKRFRKNADYIVYCKKHPVKKDYMLYTIIPRDNPDNARQYQLYMKPVFSLYDTKQIIDPTINIRHATKEVEA